MAVNDHSATCSAFRELGGRLLGTPAERVSDPQYITNRTCEHYGELPGLSVILSLIASHFAAPQVADCDGSTHSEAFIAGVGSVQLSGWPPSYFADGEPPYLALVFADEQAPN